MKKLFLIAGFFMLCFVGLGQDLFHDSLMQKYNHYRERLENEFVIISPDVEMYGYNIPAVDRLVDKWGRNTLSWSDGNSNFNNYLIFLVTEMELLKRNGHNYQHTLDALIYSLLAIERLDLYSEYNLREFYKKKIAYKGDSISGYIRYPADINGFMLRDDVSIGFWEQNHTNLGFEFGEPNEKITGTNRFKSIFKEGVVPLQAMSQDVIIHTLEAMAVIHHFLDKESARKTEINFINSQIPEYLISKRIFVGDSIDFKLWTEDLSLRFLNVMQQDKQQAAMVYKPWMGIGKVKASEFMKLFSTRWYIYNPILHEPVAQGSGNDFGLMVNAHGLASVVSEITGRDDIHLEASDRGLLKFLFKSAYYKEIKLPLGGALAIPKGWDDNKIRSLAAFGNVHGNYTNVFYSLREPEGRESYRYYVLTNYLMNKEKLRDLYNHDKEIWVKDSTWFADLLREAPKDGPVSDSTHYDFSELWCTSSRVVWPVNDLPDRYNHNWQYAGMDYLMIHNLYRLVYCDVGFDLNYEKKIRRKSSQFKDYNASSRNLNRKLFYHAPKTNNVKSINKIRPGIIIDKSN